MTHTCTNTIARVSRFLFNFSSCVLRRETYSPVSAWTLMHTTSSINLATRSKVNKHLVNVRSPLFSSLSVSLSLSLLSQSSSYLLFFFFSSPLVYFSPATRTSLTGRHFTVSQSYLSKQDERITVRWRKDEEDIFTPAISGESLPTTPLIYMTQRTKAHDRSFFTIFPASLCLYLLPPEFVQKATLNTFDYPVKLSVSPLFSSSLLFYFFFFIFSPVAFSLCSKFACASLIILFSLCLLKTTASFCVYMLSFFSSSSLSTLLSLHVMCPVDE